MSKNSQNPDRREAILILAAGAAVLPLALSGSASAAMEAVGLRPGRDQSFDLGWRFFRGAGEGFEAPTFDDASWRAVDLPHDWSIEDIPGAAAAGRAGPFDRSAEGGTATGFTQGGEGWYRKRFRIGDLPEGARAEILFDGIYMVSDVWLNGRLLGNHVHGYTPFAYDLTPHLVRGSDNVLAVRVRNLGKNSRWYAGSGLYRAVTIDVIAQPARIARWGVAAWTRRIAQGGAEIEVKTRLEDAGRGLHLRTRLKAPSGETVAEAQSSARADVRQVLRVNAPRLWSPATPELYTLETELVRGEAVIDSLTQVFGVRIVTVDAEHGMAINGEPIKLRGGCVHHDNGLLGSAAFADADERRVLRLKARGFNAIRSSHNPCSRSFREACDRHGMLLIEEAFDMWHAQKEPDDYSNYFRDHWQADIEAMVLSARNSPSVIMWSIGNEIPERASQEGVEWSWRLSNEVRRLDPTRPVTAAIHGFIGRPMVAGRRTARSGFAGQTDNASTIFLDVSGYNYKLDEIERDHETYPHRIIYASETYPREAYDYNSLAERVPYMLGEFVWTAMDYLGEAGLGATTRVSQSTPAYAPLGFPWVGAYCGDIDLIGHQKPQSRARDVVWGLSPLEVEVQRPIPDGMVERIAFWGWPDELDSWTWPGAERKPLAVRLYTSGDRVELRLNGALVGEKTLAAADKMRAEISVAYAPGTLEAIAYRGGVEIARKRLETASAPSKLRLTPERPTARRNRDGLTYVQIEVLDANNRLDPNAAVNVRLSVEGPADLIGFGSASPFAVGSFQSPQAQTYLGRAVAILRSRGETGTVRIAARADGLRGETTTVELV